MNFYQNETILADCPFCGRHDTVGFLTTNYPGERRVVCNAQNGGCGGCVGAGDSDDEAARKWNRRNHQGHNATLEHGRLQVMTDHIAERLDEFADLTEIWKRNREAGRNPQHTRSAILQIAREMTVMIDSDMAVSVQGL